MAKRTDIAWAAGIFDGEGCIYISRQRAGCKPNICSDAFLLYIKVTMVHQSTVERMRKILNVGSLHKCIPRIETSNAQYSWIASARKARKALRLMQPYLVTKAEEMRIAFAFLAIPRHWIGRTHDGGRGNTIKSSEEVDQLLRFYWKMRMAKSRWCFYERKISQADRQEIKRLGLK